MKPIRFCRSWLGAGSALLVMLLLPGCPDAGAFTLVTNGRPVCDLLLAENASPAERRAAERLVAAVENLSGAHIPSAREDANPSAGSHLLIGRGEWLSLPGFREIAETLEVVGEKGFVLETVENGGSRSLVIAGGAPHATVYAVRELLYQMGLRWYTAESPRMPNRRSGIIVPERAADFPCFPYRGVVSGVPGADPEWRECLRLNAGEGLPVDPAAPETEYVLLEISLGDILGKDLFASHPDFFPLIRGNRSDEHDLCCFTRPEAASAVAEGIASRLDRTPGITHVRLRFGSPGYICRCPECENAVRRLGETGLAFSWLQTVAEQVARRHRSVSLALADPWMAGPAPETALTGGLVTVMLDRRSFGDPGKFESAVESWTSVAEKVHLALPFADSGGEPLPFQGLNSMAPDLTRYRDLGVEGVFFTPPGGGAFVADAELRMWALSRFLWNADLDMDALIREWLRGVCGSAAGPLLEYYEHIRRLDAAALEKMPHSPASPDDSWFEEAERMVQRAYALSLSDRTANRQVRRIRLGLWLLRLGRACGPLRPKIARDADAREKHLRMLEKTVREFREFGIERVSQTESVDDFHRRIQAALKAGR